MDKPPEPGNAPLPRRERERERRRQEIMAAAVRVFSLRGFASATLDEVAQEAEFSKGTLYLYFSSKEDILFTILLTMSRNMIDIHRETLLGKRNFREELLGLYTRLVEVAFRHQDATKVITTQLMSGFSAISEEGKQTLFALHDEGTDILRARIRQAKDAGELRDLPDEAIIATIHGSLGAFAGNRCHIESIEQARKAVGMFIDILFRGIAKERENCA